MGAGEPTTFTGRRSTMELWLGVGLVVFGVAISTLGWSSRADSPYFLVLAAWMVSGGAAALVADRRRARTVSASAEGLSLIRMDGTEQLVPWEAVRRVRGTDELGFPTRDEHLELVNGDLVGLPRRLPRGSIDRWRTDLGAPAAARDQEAVRTWRIPHDKVAGWNVVIQLPVLVFVLSRPWGAFPEWARYSPVVLLVLVAAGVAVVAFAWRREAREVRADRDGLALPRFRGPRRIPWWDIVAVNGTDGRLMDEPRVELRDGSVITLPATVPATVIREWRDDLAPPAADDPVGT